MTILSTIINQRSLDVLNYKIDSFQFSNGTNKRGSLYNTLKNAHTMQIISEVKRASPSKGDIALDVDPVEQAIKYENSGACCISVLTEPHFFKGSYEDLHAVARAVSIPVLCKDFIVEPIQIDIAKAAGASVILLIVAALSKGKLTELFNYAQKQELEVLVEVHTVEELVIAEEIGAKIIGVNNRNLKTFDVDLSTTLEISKHITSSDLVLIAESGVSTVEDAMFLAESHARGLLVGETLMRSQNVEETIHAFQVPLKAGERA